MKKIITYEAYDGEVFDSEEECHKYEKEYYSAIKDMRENIRFYNDERTIFYLPEEDENFIERFEELYNGMPYITICNDLQNTTYILNDFFGFDIPHLKGDYRYDSKREEWVNAIEEFEELCTKWSMAPTTFVKWATR